MKNLILSTMLAGALLAPEIALAWGPEGHTAVGDIAEHYLTPRAKRQVHKILKENRLGGICGALSGQRLVALH